MIFSAITMELVIVASIAGQGLSYCASLRAAKMLAAISNTRFLPLVHRRITRLYT
jgi:hypothetical protein